MPLLDALGLDLERRPDAPLHRQLYDRLVDGIAAGAIKPGEKLPSTRDLAQFLGVSRNTIMLAFEHLTAEGFLEGQSGSGTYVAREPPSKAATPAPARINPALRAAGTLDRSFACGSGFADVPATLRHMRRPVPFRSNFPAVDAFPVQVWAKLAADIYRKMSPELAGELMGEGDPQGYAPLRAAIVEHVTLGRGLVCRPENVVVFAGAQHAVDLACRILLTEGETAWCEDPGYDGAYASVTAAGARPVAVPVDADGLDVAAGVARAPDARLAYVSPSKQFPLGMSLSLERRRALLDWASRADAWILEDDYDAEFRYAGRPLPALHALDREGRVIYLGTFSKTLFPGLRLGFAIVPDALVEAFVAARSVTGRYSPMLEQALVARFMSEGHFASHVRRMRKLYAQRQTHLLDALARRLSDWMTPEPTDTGMEIVARLRPGLSARRVAAAAIQEGLELMPLSALAREAEVDDLLTIGFSAFSAEQMDEGVETLRTVLVRLDQTPRAN
ncbi:GntR family transcriptional regulator/MocR family aminotransferase [Methylopila capsulata]|uniref:GntR family transcriptional regulator n=1 Tax=Methylopila capsulata TaxID=61654 RepID=A0A9W6IS08_9HYPH|nr:PLP-dependent aminotransferase family protein [Methylopila capsulata]MBM7851108.1 GntR family transcriptional regulator/MocR family aminotransferase [Methylopila capsulata]GLK54165.1 GntR family transcriptional regulator [Methylopila capsulata]